MHIDHQYHNRVLVTETDAFLIDHGEEPNEGYRELIHISRKV